MAAAIPGPGEVTAAAVDLADPESIAGCLAGIGNVDRLVIGAIERDENTIADYDIERARYLITMKLIGYTEVVHTLLTRLTPDASILFFGGLALRRPYPGSTTVTTVNGGVLGIVNTLAVELAPIRVNAMHPSVVGDSPYWSAKPPRYSTRSAARTPLGRLGDDGRDRRRGALPPGERRRQRDEPRGGRRMASDLALAEVEDMEQTGAQVAVVGLGNMGLPIARAHPRSRLPRSRSSTARRGARCPATALLGAAREALGARRHLRHEPRRRRRRRRRDPRLRRHPGARPRAERCSST